MDKVKCEAFLLAAESGSLSEAARKLGYTQPGITRMIDALESEVGFPLLLRTKKGVRPTSDIEEMLPRCRASAIPFDPPQYIHLGLAVPSLHDLSPAAKKFISYIKEAFPEPAGNASS
ncbi:LysR family transcriptional regulator [uncultured Mitsuokella sp.]|uniref:helix-turn-helix domain-containing protein n=1 Tax=uncultured Mitsuokella sp. TaxID=453120 RepID=UPI0025FA7D26|nr:LysR family transcriptional regulator [uncultured Mitsuokella sp.]